AGRWRDFERARGRGRSSPHRCSARSSRLETLPSPRMQQRTALVTGSARGIGLAIAEELAKTGHRVIGADILDHTGGPFEATHQVDLAAAAACKELITSVGRVDVLVNCAALLIRRLIPDYTVEEFDRMNAVNLRAPFLLSQAVVGQMSE